MTYWLWLLGLSVGFLIAERIRPQRVEQAVFRPQWVNDLFYIVFNGHLYAVFFAGALNWVETQTRTSVQDWFPLADASSGLSVLSWWGQCVVYLLISDFLQWAVHNMLHRIPILWQFHKVHHSAHRMDWAVNFRFHWLELVVYRTLLYLPLAALGGDPGPLFGVAVFATLWGHFNHANFKFSIGPLAYLFNCPQMHMWHHDASEEGGVSKNFGIVLSIWDRIFHTLYWPRDRSPGRLGYPGDSDMPPDVPRQMLFPLFPMR